MNILLIHNMVDVNGSAVYGAVPYYRMQKPHEVLKRLYPEIDYISSNTINVPDEVIEQTDLILLTRHQSEKDLEKLVSTGKKWGVDIDDYWHLPEDHLLYEYYKEKNIPELTEKTLKAASFVIASTEILAEKIRPLNQNVCVIHNGVDSKEWLSNKIKSRRVRFGFTQGTTHVPDIKLIYKDVQQCLYDDGFNRNAQVCLCGFSGKLDEPSIPVGYEKMLTDDLKTVDPEYRRSLILFRSVNSINKPYRRIPPRSVHDFYLVHNELDIIVAPLVDNEFNSCKSNIKMLEAAFMDCSIMCSEVGPYPPYMTKENSFSLDEKSIYEWQKIILKDSEIITEKAGKLKRDLINFELETITHKRKAFYDTLFN